MNILKKFTLLSLLMNLALTSPTLHTAATSSSSSCSSGSCSSNSSNSSDESLCVDQSNISCSIDPAILHDPEKILSCLKILHLRRTFLEIFTKMLFYNNDARVQINEKQIIQTNFRYAKKLHTSFLELKEKIVDIFQEEQITYSESAPIVQEFIDHQETIAEETILNPLDHMNMTWGFKCNPADGLTYFNSIQDLTTCFEGEEMFDEIRKKLQGSFAKKPVNTNNKLPLSIIVLSTYPYQEYLSMLYHELFKLIPKKAKRTGLPPSITPFPYHAQLNSNTLEQLLELLHKTYILLIIETLHTTDGHSIALKKLGPKITSIKTLFSHESIKQQAQQNLCADYFLDAFMRLLENPSIAQMQGYYHILKILLVQTKSHHTSSNPKEKKTLHIVLGNAPENSTETYLAPEFLPTSDKVIESILKAPTLIEKILLLHKIQPKQQQQCAPHDLSWIKEIKTPKKDSSVLKSKKIKKDRTKKATKQMQALTLTQTITHYEPPQIAYKLPAFIFKETQPTFHDQDNDWQTVDNEYDENEETSMCQEPESAEYLESMQCEQEKPKEIFIENESLAGLSDHDRTLNGRNGNSIFIYKSNGQKEINPFKRMRLSDRTINKFSNPCDHYHAFTRLVEYYGNFAQLIKCDRLRNGQCKCFYALPGRFASVGYTPERAQKTGPNGHFEFIIIKDSQQEYGGRCLHRFFRPGPIAFPGLVEQQETKT